MHAKSETTAAEQVLNGIHLPPCPTALLAAMKEAQSPDADLGKIARLIVQDVGLSAPMLKLANSPFFGLRIKVSSVPQAVTVLGLRNTVNLLSNVALRANVVPNLAGMDEFWDRSNMTALAASRIAAQIPGTSCDDAYTVGLFHDCGIPVLMQKYPDYLKNVDEIARISGNVCAVENSCYSTTHAVVGNLLARNWLLPPNMCRAILYHHDLTIFASVTDPASIEICNWVSIVQAAEYIVDSHLGLHSDWWEIWQPPVLKRLQFSIQEFDELRSDIANVLSGD
ncbi:MAG: HDOD domain-containing protein [Gallionella sp.]|nr:HDOD domain-containing protein [Gallionella sp.]